MPDGKEIVRDIVERPESVFLFPVSHIGAVLLIEEYNVGPTIWQLTIPGEKVTDPTPDGIRKQAEVELREKIGYRSCGLEKLLDFYSHLGYSKLKAHLLVAHDSA